MHIPLVQDPSLSPSLAANAIRGGQAGGLLAGPQVGSVTLTPGAAGQTFRVPSRIQTVYREANRAIPLSVGMIIVNNGTGAVTLSADGATINGASTASIPAGSSIFLMGVPTNEGTPIVEFALITLIP